MLPYEQIVYDLSPRDQIFHYFPINDTLEKFVEDVLSLNYPSESQDPLDGEYPFPIMYRKERLVTPAQIGLELGFNLISYNHEGFIYPKGTTHFYCSLYISEYDRDSLPLPIKIDGDQWYLYKNTSKEEMNFEWIPLEKGTRSMEGVHSLQELLDHDNDKELVYPPYVIDVLIDTLPEDSYEQLLLADRRYTLSELFEQRHSPEKLLNYFKLGRVWRTEFDETDPHYVNDAEKILNKIYARVVSSDIFIKAYKEAIL